MYKYINKSMFLQTIGNNYYLILTAALLRFSAERDIQRC